MEILVAVVMTMPEQNQKTFATILEMCGSPEPTKGKYVLDMTQVPRKVRRIFCRAYAIYASQYEPPKKASSKKGIRSSDKRSGSASSKVNEVPPEGSESGSSSDR